MSEEYPPQIALQKAPFTKSECLSLSKWRWGGFGHRAPPPPPRPPLKPLEPGYVVHGSLVELRDALADGSSSSISIYLRPGSYFELEGIVLVVCPRPERAKVVSASITEASSAVRACGADARRRHGQCVRFSNGRGRGG